jgi:Outer membrane protein/protective antigen OMA87
MIKSLQRLFAVAMILLGLIACNITKHVPDGDYLLDKVYIESDVPEFKERELKPYLKQEPNFKMLNWNKTLLQLYSVSDADSTSKWDRFWMKLGEPPVIFDENALSKTEDEFEKLLFNSGYMDAEVHSKVDTTTKKANITYYIKGNIPYTIGKYTIQIEDKTIEQELFGGESKLPEKTMPGESPEIYVSLIKPEAGALFDRNLLDAERDRITTLLRNRGYYEFNKSYIHFDADSTHHSHIIDLKMILDMRELRAEDGSTHKLPHQKFYYNKVYYYLDYDPLKYATLADYPRTDSIVRRNTIIYYNGDNPMLSSSVLDRNTFIIPTSTYSLIAENLTYSALSSLSALSNVQIEHRESRESDSLYIDSHIMTIPSKKQTVSFSIEGTNTHGDLGVAATTGYTHRNLFKRSETLSMRLRGAYEAISETEPYWEIGADASIVIPKILFPFVGKNFMKSKRTSTEFLVSYNNQSRQEYDRTLLSGGLSYTWQSRINSSVRHKFSLLDIDYVYLPRTDSVFMSNLPPSAQLFGYTNQFIVGMSYTYQKTTPGSVKHQKGSSSFRFTIESSGNLLYGLANAFDWKKDNNGSYQLFNTHFAQFVKTDFDYSRSFILGDDTSIAFRVGGGIGYPHGNADMLPFEKRYYSGGANSVRAWSVRELGPGSYVADSTTTFFNQSGDIKLDLNLELRSRLFWKFEVAAFIDAGNIWTIKDYEGQEGGKFQLDRFYKEIALGYGLGLRLNFDFFLVRFDAGWKAYNPAKKGSDAWVITNPNFKDNWAWHLAVGYPF